ncbi:MAG: tRNA 4-thiouridine(8) synthase ThiI [Zetaproteobacteria bacterium CG2_30_46_52]|nr:MAG: tRNA 4-thiouridine(8) synthase ThiI [Zetaproteobacteria bacterium CG2_30_46_52]
MKIILIHFAELTLKGKNRHLFEKRLAKNLKQILRPISVTVEQSRMVMEMADVDAETIKRLALIPGISNFAVADICEPTVESMQQQAAKTLAAAFDHVEGKRFAVRTKRADKQHAMICTEVNYEVGGYLKEHFKLVVDLKNPEFTVFVELMRGMAFVYTDKIKGIGGLPVGTSGHGVVLFSGGIDSPVAAYTMMKRGMQVTLVHLYNSTINRDFSKIESLAKQLSLYQGRVELIMIDLEEFQRHAIALVPAPYRMIIYKRQMIRSAALVAEKLNAFALVTGDALGQVASQTLENIHAIYDASTLPLLSPLLGYDKEEIIAIARRIGTYEISIEAYCDICSYLIAKHPETKGKRDMVASFEADLPTTGLALIQQERIFFNGEVRVKKVAAETANQEALV